MTCCRGRAPLLLLVAIARWSGAAWWFASAPTRGSAAVVRSGCGFTAMMGNLDTRAGRQTSAVTRLLSEGEREDIGLLVAH